jgi:hypothetical protein
MERGQWASSQHELFIRLRSFIFDLRNTVTMDHFWLGKPERGKNNSITIMSNDLKSLPLLQAEKLSQCDRDIWSFTMRLFEREVQGRSFLVVSFLHHAAGHGTLGNSSKW